MPERRPHRHDQATQEGHGQHGLGRHVIDAQTDLAEEADHRQRTPRRRRAFALQLLDHRIESRPASGRSAQADFGQDTVGGLNDGQRARCVEPAQFLQIDRVDAAVAHFFIQPARHATELGRRPVAGQAKGRGSSLHHRSGSPLQPFCFFKRPRNFDHDLARQSSPGCDNAAEPYSFSHIRRYVSKRCVDARQILNEPQPLRRPARLVRNTQQIGRVSGDH